MEYWQWLLLLFNMSEETTEQVTPAQEPKLGPNAEFGAALDAAQNPTKDIPPETKPQTPAKPDIHAINNRNAQRRIQQKREFRSMQSRIQELEKQLNEYKEKPDPASQSAAAQLGERIGDMQAISQDAQYNEFNDRAIDAFGEEGAKHFMQQTDTYAEYVNKNEPELLKYTDRPYGMALLAEWYKRMDQPKTRQQWLSFTSFEKGKVLDNFYRQIAQIVEHPKKQPNAPIPGSGRQSNGIVPDNDFGLALTAELNRRKQLKMR